MTSSIVNFIVDQYLSNLLEIDPDKTKSSLWDGYVELSHMKIKPKLFEDMDIPYFEVVHGYVESMKIELSLPRFWLAPVKVKIKNIFFMAKQKNLTDLNETKELKSMEAYKQAALKRLEELRTEINNLAAEPGMADSLIKNIQIEIEGIVFRMEDSVSYPAHPFALGMVLKHIGIYSTGSDFKVKEGEMVPQHDKAFKKCVLSHLSFFLDFGDSVEDIAFSSIKTKEYATAELTKHLETSKPFYNYCMEELFSLLRSPESHDYLMYDLQLTVDFTQNDKFRTNFDPRMSLNINFSKMKFQVGPRQMTILAKLTAYVGMNEFFRYAVKKRFYCRTLTNKEKMAYIENYTELHDAKFVNVDEAKSKKLEKKLGIKEHALTYDQIASMREASFLLIDNQNDLRKITEEISSAESSWNIGSNWVNRLFWRI